MATPSQESVALQLSDAEREHCQATHDFIASIIQQQGAISFQKWMHYALYQPHLGYYDSPKIKLAGSHHNVSSPQPSGDFVTAPELSPWFGRTLALQIAQVLEQVESPQILEFGAGSGKLAHSILQSLNRADLKYYILEVSADLKALQQETLKEYADQVIWLSQLPEQFSGCMLANEVLDAMPVRLVERQADGAITEKYVSLDTHHRFIWQEQRLNADELPIGIERLPQTHPYCSEFNDQGRAWITQLAQILRQGAILLIDYGFPADEYYLPQRQQGTLICHLHHQAHDDVLSYPGVQDITAHVDFTAIAESAHAQGLEILGYTSQANFLINCGILQLLSQLDPQDIAHYASQVGPVQKLLSEAEMGELFKAMLLGKGLDMDPLGFSRGDRRHQL
ncbi:class I SAM-dependent methyltransferase [Brackiella oedipodis]|uniref:class I SAM-dependent methyltransferase n=1 Tax=Brackiella oedipodis TaxID=124225 RepID=UPI00048B4594|nr:SAM-dependent methyltransferase [Brackiella oedipodis]